MREAKDKIKIQKREIREIGETIAESEFRRIKL